MIIPCVNNVYITSKARDQHGTYQKRVSQWKVYRYNGTDEGVESLITKPP